MRKTLILVLAAMVVASLAVGTATAGKSKPQKVKGSILTRAPFPPGENAPMDSCYSGLHRRLNVVGQEQVQGIVGYHFNVNKKTAGEKFVLKPTGGFGDVDLDITFYTEFGSIEDAADTQYAPANISFDARKPGGEKGIVPRGMKKVIVCMYDGFGASFTYTAQTS